MNELNRKRLVEASKVLGAVLAEHNNRDADLNGNAEVAWGLNLVQAALCVESGLDELREAVTLLQVEMDWGLDLNDGVGYSDLEWMVRTLDAAVDAVTPDEVA